MSIRQTRTEYVNSLSVRRSKPTRLDVAQAMASNVRKTLRAKGLWKMTPVKTWLYSVNMGPEAVVYAHTRSEARAQIKAILGIKKGRLPSYVELMEAPREDQPASTGAA